MEAEGTGGLRGGIILEFKGRSVGELEKGAGRSREQWTASCGAGEERLLVGQPPLGVRKRRRLESEALGHGVREAIYEEIEVGRKTTRFGVVANGTPFWEWAVPAGGRLAWVWGANLGDQLACRERLGKDVWLEGDANLGDLPPVDVVLFEGAGPGSTHAVWTDLKTVNAIVWFGGNRRCRPPSASLHSGLLRWVVDRTALHHGALGGVTRP